ncbi:uncharacterized protein ARMOST_18908 [Armillaria ostoyae]|uniref:Uncharacterized protein n=1 Tax=Armillaria ostoyae TaxID=47428 RepID=A0A284S316_ARMOS|nr:uncharacterized protein ARMOST_18908 [Armillaria ostoyae]
MSQSQSHLLPATITLRAFLNTASEPHDGDVEKAWSSLLGTNTLRFSSCSLEFSESCLGRVETRKKRLRLCPHRIMISSARFDVYTEYRGRSIVSGIQ